MNALQELIRTRMAELNRSYGEIARRGGLPRSTVYHLAANHRPVRVPNPRTLERLAVGLDVPEHVVRAAAASAAGFVLDEQSADDPEIEVLIASLAKLSPQDRRHVSALVRSLIDATAIQDSDGSGKIATDSPGTSQESGLWWFLADRSRVGTGQPRADPPASIRRCGAKWRRIPRDRGTGPSRRSAREPLVHLRLGEPEVG